MKTRRVAVICGGISSEREVSLRSGAQIFKHLDRSRFTPSLIEISKKGEWILIQAGSRRVRRKLNPLELNKIVDVGFIGLHGTFGEDGRVQSLLELAGVPYTGSGVLASALAMDKYKTWQFLRGQGIRMPDTRALTRAEYRNAVLRRTFLTKTTYPCVVKPNASGSSVGVSIVRSRRELDDALKKALAEDSTVLVQKYIQGKEITCGVLGNSRGRIAPRALPTIEIVSHATFFDYHAKYASKKTQEICPAPISKSLNQTVQRISETVHCVLGCDGLTRSDFILANGAFYFLEINTLPGLTEQSLCPKQARAAGMSMTELFTRLIQLALQRTV